MSEIKKINGKTVKDETARNSITELQTQIDNIKVPTKTSDLTNDSDFVNSTFVTNKIAEASLSGGEVDLSGYVTKERGNANQITFADGQTFQTKLDNGTLKGEKGDKGERGEQGLQGIKGDKGDKGERGLQGIQGEKGDKGDTGANGEDGLTTAVSVNGNTYTHSNGTITLPNYPTVPTNISAFTNDSNYASETYVNNKIAEASLSGGEVDLSGYVTKETGNANQITFADGQTFQAKLDAGTLKGDKGDQGLQGVQGEKGDKGDTGEQGIQGEKGDKGDTGEQGIQGIQGLKGDKGDPFTYEDFTPEQLLALKGDKGDKGDTGEQGIQGVQGATGQDGATFTPSVDTEGNLSWTNDKGLVNPPTVNIKGEKGDSGTGSSGANINDTTASATTTYSSNKIETIKEGLNSQIDQKANQSDLAVERARIDSFTSLQEGSTTGDAELIDGRIGADGTIYTNIGDAIRTQYGNLDTLLDIEYVPISNNCIDDSKYVGKNFDSIFGHSGNKKFKLDKKFTSSSVKGYIELEDGTLPSTAFQIYLTSTVEGVEGIQLSLGGTLVTIPNFDKYDEISVECWQTYDKNIKTFFIGNYDDEYDNFKTQLKSKAINTMESKLTSIHPEQCTFFNKVDNLLKGAALKKGYAINPSYGLPDAIPGIPRTTTDYMELRDDCESTYCNTNGYIYYYDANKNYLQSISPQNTETPAGIVALPQSDTKIKYIRYTFVTEDDATLASYWITDQGKPYENDKLYIPKDMIEDMIEDMSKTESWYKGKKICAYGDSVTEQNKWQGYVSSYFNCSFYNRGVGGTTVTQVNSSTNHMSGDTRINTIPTDSDVILIFAGHNDWSYASIAMGDLKTDSLSESTSFKSAFALMLKKIQNRCPNARLITMTPVGGRTEDAATNQDKQFYIRDLCMTDFALAVKEVSGYYGIPCIDVNANCGINTLNHTTYIADLVHPNDAGGKLIANEVINGMKRFEPIDL